MSSHTNRTRGASFAPVDLSQYYNWPVTGHQPQHGGNDDREQHWWSHIIKRVESLPRDMTESWGVPYRMADDGASQRVLMLTIADEAVHIPIAGTASHLCFAHCWEQLPSTMGHHAPREGLVVAEYRIEYEDGDTHTQPIRGRFEVNMAESIGPPWLAQEFRSWETVDPMKPRDDQSYGELQFGLKGALSFGVYMVWNYAMPNPHPEKALRSLTISSRSESPLFVVALSLYSGASHPLRHLPRHVYRVERPDGAPAIVAGAEVDLGVVARVERTQSPRDEQWLASEYAGVHNTWGGGLGFEPSRDQEDLLHIVGAEDASVSVTLDGKDESLRFSLGDAFHEGESKADDHSLRVLGREHQWMTVRVVDDANGLPTPVRIHFSDKHGRYIAPHGHHELVNTNWFEDYGADVSVGGRNYAYVDGEFAVDLPVGDVYVEIVKGFEYTPIRRKLTVRPGEKQLDLNISRWIDLRSRGWVTADTHVHFISPHTAWLEGAAEGVNVINLLASQWGRLFTNVGDLTGRIGVAHDDTIVYVGTENRNHMLGHMSMLGTQGNLPVYPMCAGGPTEAWVGDPDFRALAEWAFENKRKGGVVIRPHFPHCGFTEDPVSIIAGLVDALEIFQLRGSDFPTQEWYRYLNCGYRVAVCGGTDKMSAGFAVGWLRTYAKIDPSKEFTYDSWADAVRSGRTFATSGPLMDMTVDGCEIGDDIVMSRSGGTVEVHAAAQSHIPLGSLEVVVNGQVVAKEEPRSGARELSIVQRIPVEQSGWIAARCHGLPGHAGAHVAAHTSPVYVTCGDDRPFDPEAAEHMLSLVDGTVEYLNTLAVNYDEDSRRRMVRLFDETRKELRGRLVVETKHRI